MKEQYMDIPVNIRQRLDDVNGDEYCGFYVTEVTFKCDVTLETKLWDLARNIQGQLKTIIGQDQHLLFAKVINPKKPREPIQPIFHGHGWYIFNFHKNFSNCVP